MHFEADAAATNADAVRHAARHRAQGLYQRAYHRAALFHVPAIK